MPKTKLQSVIFTAIMVFCMVYCMTVYTVSAKMGGLTYGIFLIALKEMWVEYVVVYLLIFFVITNLARKLASKIAVPGKDNMFLVILSVQCCTVLLIVPCVTLFATFFHGGFTADWFTSWIELACSCFPVALCLQVFLAGPLVRKIFRMIFAKQLAA